MIVIVIELDQNKVFGKFGLQSMVRNNFQNLYSSTFGWCAGAAEGRMGMHISGTVTIEKKDITCVNIAAMLLGIRIVGGTIFRE